MCYLEQIFFTMHNQSIDIDQQSNEYKREIERERERERDDKITGED